MTSRAPGTNPTLLAVATMPVWPVRDGYSLRVANLLRELAREWDVTLVAPAGYSTEEDVLALGVRRFIAVARPTWWTHRPWEFDADALRESARRAIERDAPDVALLWGGSEFLLDEGVPLPHAVLDRIDCMTLVSWRDAGRSERPLRHRLRALRAVVDFARYERRAVRRFSSTIVVGQDDAATLRRISGRRTVHVVPNGATLQPITTPAEEAPEPTVVFTGVMAYRPNVEAVRFFAERVWPEVHQRLPQAVFQIVGRDPTADVSALSKYAGVQVLGEVPDMVAVLRCAWLAVAPMRTGAGIKNKVLEAWAVGKPVVMTQVATNGLSVDATLQKLVVDDPRSTAALIVRLLTHPEERRAIGAAAHAVVAQSHSWSSAATAVSQLLRRAMSQRKR